jgi:hypothetical protein
VQTIEPIVDAMQLRVHLVESVIDLVEATIHLVSKVVQPLVAPALSHLVHGDRG